VQAVTVNCCSISVPHPGALLVTIMEYAIINSENIDKETKQMIEKLIIEKSSMYLFDVESDSQKRDEGLINMLESVKETSEYPEQINEINRKLLMKYKTEDPKLISLIQEIKDKDPKEFYSRAFTMLGQWDKFPENRGQLLEDLIANKDLIFASLKDFSASENNEKFYHEGFTRLINKIEADLGSDAKERFIKETGYQPKSTS
jgi:hypothetical protein